MIPIIEDNIPLPKFRKERAISDEYKPLRQLKVGQSYFIKGKKLSTVRIYLQSKTAKKVEGKFTAAECAEGGAQGVRIWRKS